MTRVGKLLAECGQALRPMATAPRDGRTVLCYSEVDGLVAVHWTDDPLPKWLLTDHAGYIDQAFLGWLDGSTFRPFREEEITHLLVAFIDDMRNEKRNDVLKLLEAPATPKESNDNPKAG